MQRLTGTCAVILLIALSGCPGKEGDDSQSGSSTGPSSSSETELTTGSSGASATEPATDTVDPTGGPDTTGATETGSDTGMDTDTGESEFIDLFACEVPQACETIFWHLDPEPATAVECAAQLVVSEKSGLIRALDTPGPNIDETDYFTVVLGDGTALLQTRERHCDQEDTEPCDFDTFPWEPGSAHQICDVVVPEGLAESCGCGMESCEGCWWVPFNGLANCKPVEEFTCAAVLDLLAGKG